jgi:hypothetical protein
MVVMSLSMRMETRAAVDDRYVFDLAGPTTVTATYGSYTMYEGTIRIEYSQAYIAASNSIHSRYFVPLTGSQMAGLSDSTVINYDTYLSDGNGHYDPVYCTSSILNSIVSAGYGDSENKNSRDKKCCEVRFTNNSSSAIQLPCGTYRLILHSKGDGLNLEFYNITIEVYDPNAGSSSNTDDSSSQAAVQSGSSGSSGCDHDFQWVCVKEPTAGEDGYDEYKCTKCGLVSQTRTTSGFSTFSDKTLDVVKSTPEGQPVSITTDSFWSFNHDFTDMIAARKSGDITVDFWYKNSHYKMTIPAGTDFTPYLTGTGKGYIGFMKIYSLVGGTCIGHR